MNKIVLYPNDCIKEIKEYIIKNNYQIIDEKTKFEYKYISTYDQKEYPIKIDWYISFQTKKRIIHKIYFYFLDFHTNDIFKISDIKSKDNPYGQMTTKVADFKYFGETRNQGFTNYRYKVSHKYHNFFKALDKNKNPNEIPYVCVLLKYKNHAGEWPRGRYYANSFFEFMKKIQENKYSELKITIYALDNSLKAVGNVSYKLINNPITENAPNKPNQIPPTEGIIPNTPNNSNGNNENNGNNGNGENNNSNKPEKPNKQPDHNKPNENNESGWKKFFKKPVNLFFMTLISCGIVGGFITWIIFKNQLNKKIGGKKLKKIKAIKKTKNR